MRPAHCKTAAAAQSLGASVAPLLGGMIADRYGLTKTFWFLAFTIVVANLFILAMPKRDEPVIPA